MKTRLWLILAFAFICFSCCSTRADALFQLFWRVTYYTKNSTGHIVSAGFTERNYVNQVARNTGIDATDLILVYRPNKRDAAVVQKNGAFVASVIQMQTSFTDIVNPNGSVIVRHALLTDGSQSDPLGSFFGLERPSRNSHGGLASDSLVGTVIYSKSGIVYGGQVSTGSRVQDTTNAP